MGKAAEDLVLFEPIGHGHLHGPVEGKLAVVDPAEHPHRLLHHVVAFEQLAAELRPGDLDLLGQGDFLLPREQRDFAHLRQVHPHRVVRPRFRLVGTQQGIIRCVQLVDVAVDDDQGVIEIVVEPEIAVIFIVQVKAPDGSGRIFVVQFVQQSVCVVQCKPPESS